MALQPFETFPECATCRGLGSIATEGLDDAGWRTIVRCPDCQATPVGIISLDDYRAESRPQYREDYDEFSDRIVTEWHSLQQDRNNLSLFDSPVIQFDPDQLEDIAF